MKKSKSTSKVQKKEQDSNRGRVTTIYLPKGYREVIDIRSQLLLGVITTHGRISEYISKLILRDLVNEGLYSKDGKPNKSKIADAARQLKKKSVTDF